MKQLYLECCMGAAGDMIMGALLDLYTEKEKFLQTINSLKLPGINVACVPSQKCGILGSRIHVFADGQEESGQEKSGCGSVAGTVTDHRKHHSSYGDVAGLIASLPLPEQVKEDSLAVYALIRDAEAKVHGQPVDQIHFHELGTMDAITDVVGCCLMFYLLAPDFIIASPINVGSGFVRCAHGVLPVPAPATVNILRGVPIYSSKVQGELCTPTGAAILKHFVREYSELPLMSTDRIGYGFGEKDFEIANCVRAFIGESKETDHEIAELCCNLDDMTPEAVGYATEVLLNAGALDVYSSPVYMKKNRPAVLLTCLCKTADSEKIARLILQHTTTIGVRKKICERRILTSAFSTVKTKYGEIGLKISSGHGVKKYKPEYSDVASAAKQLNLDFATVYREALLKAEKETR